MDKEDKTKRGRKAFNRIKKKYKGIAANEFDLLLPLIKRTAFLEVELEDLEKTITKKGYSEAYQNGAAQSGVKGVPEVQAYISLHRQYLANIKLLDDKLPPEEKESKLQKFLSE